MYWEMRFYTSREMWIKGVRRSGFSMFTPPTRRFGHNQDHPKPTKHRTETTRDQTDIGLGYPDRPNRQSSQSIREQSETPKQASMEHYRIYS